MKTITDVQLFPASNATGQWLRICADGLGLLASILPPRKPLTEAMVAAYAFALQDLSLDQLRGALGLAAKQCVFMPSPAELRGLAGVQDDLELRALAAWALVSEAVVRHGAYRSIYFTDGIIAAVILTMGGWVTLCGQAPEEFDKFTRREFLRSYSLIARRGGEIAPQRLIGLHEQTNRSNGYGERETCVVIGETPQRVLTAECKAIEGG